MKQIAIISLLFISLSAAAQEERHNFYVTGKDNGFHFSSFAVKAQACDRKQQFRCTLGYAV